MAQYRHCSSFNPRTHEGCDTISSAPNRSRVGFQSTHPRRVRRRISFYGCATGWVSIHAPTKGATRQPAAQGGDSGVSIHAPTTGATTWAMQASNWLPCFNPRTHEGCDTRRCAWPPTVRCFNPRTHEGCDLVARAVWKQSGCFNPRTHEGCDCHCYNCFLLLPGFQSTHPRRVRLRGACDGRSRGKVSIHAPTKGATRVRQRRAEGCAVSIHAPTKGATLVCPPKERGTGCFNPRTHEGCDVAFDFVCKAELVFQSTHPRRVRLLMEQQRG